MESAATRIEPLELESAATHSQPQDGISLKLYPAAGTRVSRRMEPAVTRIQPLELESAANHSQPQDRIDKLNSHLRLKVNLNSSLLPVLEYRWGTPIFREPC